MRRQSDNWVNATHILKAAGFDKPARTRILERDVQKGNHEKVQGGYGKFQGTTSHQYCLFLSDTDRFVTRTQAPTCPCTMPVNSPASTTFLIACMPSSISNLAQSLLLLPQGMPVNPNSPRSLDFYRLALLRKGNVRVTTTFTYSALSIPRACRCDD